MAPLRTALVVALAACNGGGAALSDAPAADAAAIDAPDDTAIDGPPDAALDAAPDASPDAPTDAPPAVDYWLNAVLGTAAENSRIYTVAMDASGNIYACGVSTKQGVHQLLIESVTPAGAPRWRVEIPNPGVASHLVVSGSTVHVAGWFFGTAAFGTTTLDAGTNQANIFIARLGTDGSVIGARAFGTPSFDETIAIGVDAAGNVTVAGNAGVGTLDFGDASLVSENGSPIGGFVASFDPAGNHRWSHGFDHSTASGQYAGVNGMATRSAGDVVVTGGFKISADFGGGPVSSPAANAPSGYVVHYRPDGSIRVLHVAHAGLDDQCWSVAFAPTGKLATNCIRSEPDPDQPGSWMLRGRIAWYSPDGVELGAKLLIARDAWTNRVAFDTSGYIVSSYDIGSATLDGQPLPNREADQSRLVVTLDPSTGALVDARRIGIGSFSFDTGAFAISPDNTIIAGGSFATNTASGNVSIDFGFGAMPFADGGYGYLVRAPH